jgi:PHD-finger
MPPRTRRSAAQSQRPATRRHQRSVDNTTAASSHTTTNNNTQPNALNTKETDQQSVPPPSQHKQSHHQSLRKQQKSRVSGGNHSRSAPKSTPSTTKTTTTRTDSTTTTTTTTTPCCLCHCALDYSDLQACQSIIGDTDNNNDNHLSRVEPTNHDDSKQQLALSLYNPHNGLLQCDSCHRRYHYQCHFVPIFSLPAQQQQQQQQQQKRWECLVCTSQRELQAVAAAASCAKSRPYHHTTSATTSSCRNSSSSKPNDDDSVLFQWNDLFQSPPVSASVAEQEAAWESHPTVIDLKARTLSSSLSSLVKAIAAALSRHGRSTATLETLTANARNRQHFLQRGRSRGAAIAANAAANASHTSNVPQKQGSSTVQNGSGVRESMSQELMQCLVARVTAQRTLRHLALFALQHVQRSAVPRSAWDALMRHCQQQTSQTMAATNKNTLFPFGCNTFARRWTPVTPEYDIQTKTEATAFIPFEIDVSKSTASKGKKPPKTLARDQVDDENDDGISLDELKCCVCLKGECSDENDLLLCDGNGCFRAYHMECLHPHVSPETAAEDHADDDWFCPLCETLADVLYQIQVGTVGGEEWEERRLARHQQQSNAAEETDVGDSLASWTDADQVFHDAEWAYQTVQQMRQGVHTADSQRLLSQVLGMEPSTPEHKRPPQNTVNRLHPTVNAADNEPEDDDNVDEDGHFDMYSYQEERRIEREERRKETGEDDDSVSTHSSQVTLVELSSVELNVGKDELAALTDVEEDESDEDEKPPVRQSRRLRTRHPRNAGQPLGNGPNDENADLGRMDVTNIVAGKRKRKTVDYQLLNQAMFGEVGAAALETLDDGDDFVFDGNNKAAFHSDEDGDSDDEENEDNDSEEDSSNGEQAGKDGESSKEADDSDDDDDDCIVEIVRKRAERLANGGAKNGTYNGRRGKIASGSKRN